MIHQDWVEIPFRRRSALIRCHVAGDGRPVVLLHGWAMSWYLWKGTMLALARAGFRAYAPDHIGCGDSSKPLAWYSPADHDAYVDALVTALKLDEVILIGHSHGGHIALSYTLNHPRRVSRLILVDPAYSFLHQARRRLVLPLILASIPSMGELMLQLTPPRLLRWLISQDWGGLHRPRTLPPDVLDRIVADFLRHASPRVFNAIRYLFVFSLPVLARFRPAADLQPTLGRVAVPTLVVWGCHDTLLRPAAFASLRDGIPGAVALPIAAAGHTPQIEAPGEFQRGLLDFLAAQTYPQPATAAVQPCV